jgi:hypothetical protein
MQKALIAGALALFGLAAAPVCAMEVAPLSGVGSNITLVAGGCGAGFHRGPNGGCRRNGGAVVVAPGYHYHGGRRCWWRHGVRVCN